jgi:prefoldin subunit 5
MTESYNQPYQPKIEPEALPNIENQLENSINQCNQLINSLEAKLANIRNKKEGFKQSLDRLKLEKLKQSREGYSNLESESV